MKEHERAPVERLGRYELLGTLGSGGMGDVHRARAYGAAGTVKELCVKRIRASRLADSGAVERFVSEARLSMRLSHGNIVPVFDFGRADGQYFLAMEWVDGADARALLRSGPLRPCVAAHVAAEVARALDYAHSLDPHEGGPLVHRDVKPGNVLVSVSGDVKLVDFGVAVTSWSAATGCAGTLAYMAPEQERGDLVDPRADLFSLGVVLAELLGMGRAREPAELSPQCPEALYELLRELLAADPEARPADAKSVASRLEDFVAHARLSGDQAPRDALSSRVRARKAVVKENREAQILASDLSFLRDGDELTAGSMLEATCSTAAEHTPGRSDSAPSDRGGASTSEASLGTRRRRRAWMGLAVVLLVGSAALRFGWTHASAAGGSEGRPATAQTATSAEDHSVESDPATSREIAPTLADPYAAPALAAQAAARVSAARTRLRQAAPLAQPHGSTRPERRSAHRAPTVTEPAEANHAPATPQAPPSVPEPEITAAPARVDINASPWARVFVDDRELGTTPLFNLELPPGSHRLRLTNEPLGRTREMRLDLLPSSHRRIVVDLAATGE